MAQRRPDSMLLLLLLAAAAAVAVGDAGMTLSPDTLTANGQNITVTWSGIPVVDPDGPESQMLADTIALIPTDAPFGEKWPIKVGVVAVAGSCLTRVVLLALRNAVLQSVPAAAAAACCAHTKQRTRALHHRPRWLPRTVHLG
jgi:hypothetical protein